MTDSSETECFTLVFKGDITKFKGNPLRTDTPFGVPFSAAIGDVIDAHDKLQEAVENLHAAAEQIVQTQTQ